MHRQAAAASAPAVTSTASPVSVVNHPSLLPTAPPLGQTENTVAASNCDDASAFILSQGLTLHDETTLGKYRSALTSIQGPLIEPHKGQVNKTFRI